MKKFIKKTLLFVTLLTLTVALPLSATTPDTESPTKPAAMSYTVTDGIISLAWHASTDNVAVDCYKIYDNYRLVKVARTNSAVISDLKQGAHVLYIYAVDAADNHSPVTILPVNVGPIQSYSNWRGGIDYVAGDTVYFEGRVYTCWQSHTSLRGWEPTLTPALWKAGEATPRWDVEAPTAPSNITLTAKTDKSLSLEWTGSTDNVGVYAYKIYLENYYYYTVKDPVAFLTNLWPGVTLCIEVSAIDSCGNESPRSEVVKFTTEQCSNDPKAPSMPTDVKVKEVTNTTVELEWAASTDCAGVAGYKIYANGVFQKIVKDTKTVLEGLRPETVHLITIGAFDAAGNESPQSEFVTVLTKANGGNLDAKEWQPNVSYNKGDKVLYAGEVYICIQGHTSLSVWPPAIVPALWQR